MKAHSDYMRMSKEQLVEELKKVRKVSWQELRGRQFTKNQLADMLVELDKRGVYGPGKEQNLGLNAENAGAQAGRLGLEGADEQAGGAGGGGGGGGEGEEDGGRQKDGLGPEAGEGDAKPKDEGKGKPKRKRPVPAVSPSRRWSGRLRKRKRG